MKAAGPLGEPAALLSGLATDSIPQTHPFPNSPSTAGALVPIDAARLPVAGELDDLDALLAALDRLDDPSLTPAPVAKPKPLHGSALLDRIRSRAANFVNPPMSPSARSRQLERLVLQGFDELDILKIRAAEDARASVREPLQHPGTTQSPDNTETKTTAKQPVASISAKAIAARNTRSTRNTRTTPAASKTKRHDTSDARLAAYHDALAALGHTVAVTARLRPDIEAKMRQIGQEGGNPLDWLRRAINRELDKLPGAVLGYVWLMGVTSKGGDAWHPHGELAVADLAQLPAIKAAILRAVGVSPNKRFRRRQVKFKAAWSAGWLGYYGDINVSEARQAGVPGSLVVASGNVKSTATKATAAFRKSIKAKQRSAAQKPDKSLMTGNCNDAATVAKKTLVAESFIEHNRAVQPRTPGPTLCRPKISQRGCPSRPFMRLSKRSSTRPPFAARRSWAMSIRPSPRRFCSPVSSPTTRPTARSTGPPK